MGALSNMASLRFVLPELILVAGILAVVGWDLAGSRKREGVLAIAVAALAGSALATLYYVSRGDAAVGLFQGLLASDPFAHFFRVFFALATLGGALYAAPLPAAGGGVAKGRGAGEFYALLLAVALGMNLMAMARNLLMIYLSLEIVSVISFVLAGFAHERRASGEAALKYVVFGGVSSGIMLYGMSWLFGVTGSLDLPTIARVVTTAGGAGAIDKAVFIAVICMMAGFGYKVSAVPFHMWAPDVYEGAPTPVTAFFSVGPKAAGFAVMMRFFADALRAHDAPEVGHGIPWTVVVGIFAMATMTAGNLAAMGQRSVKRLLAYSSVAHAGYMLLGVAMFSASGSTAVLFYLATYYLMNLGAFAVVLAVEEKTGSDAIDQFMGLGRRAPALAVPMAVFLFSLTGLPPMAGFVGKFYLFASLLEAPTGFRWLLALVGVLNSVVALFYYARILRAMYLTAPAEGSDGPIEARGLYRNAALVLAVPTLVLGVYWPPVMSLVERSLSMLR